tara:strand:- start:1751 stop:1996 length:246 start_codon:yes stop_codon:yes gene_type:complete
MAWSRQGLKGMNADDPISNVKQGPGSNISDTGAIESLANFKIKPGAYSFDKLSGIEFPNLDANFNVDGISRWFRDDGSTTT